MSKLTSFTSASDALIQPTGAANGQTLTWNAAAGQFEPTDPLGGGTTLPNFTANQGLRGDGTNVPVVDSRLNFATADALDLVGSTTNGLRVITTANKVSLLAIGVGATVANNLEISGNTPPLVTNANGGWLELNAGASRGTGFSAIRFGVPDATATPGQALNSVFLNWQMYSLSPTESLLEGVKLNNRVAAQFNSNMILGSSGTGNTSVNAEGSGLLNIGVSGTGNVNIGSNSTTRLTTLNGIVKRPNMATLYTTGVGQALLANGAAAVNWNAAVITIGSGITVSGTAITVSRTGIYRVYGGISITSATVNTRGIIAPVAGTAVFASPSAQAVRQTTANIATENSYEFLLNVTTAGTFSIVCTMVAASSIQAFNSTAAAAATTTLYIQEIG